MHHLLSRSRDEHGQLCHVHLFAQRLVAGFVDHQHERGS